MRRRPSTIVVAQVPPVRTTSVVLLLYLLGSVVLVSTVVLATNGTQLERSLSSSRQAPNGWHLNQNQEEEAIVINSVHSGLARKPAGGASSPPAAHDRPAQPLKPPINPNRWPTSGRPNPRPSSQVSHQENDRQEGRSGLFVSSSSQPSIGQQPSQEFDWQGSRLAPATGNSNGRWPLDAHRKPAQDLPSAFNPLNSPPYALPTAGHPQIGQNHHWGSSSSSSSSNEHQATLIRDTSALQQALLLQEEEHQPPATNATQWMQSVRDNHHGPLRSRFNLSWPLGGQLRESLVASMNADAHTSDRGNNPTYGSSGGFGGYDQQQARSEGNQEPGNNQGSNWSRRNSKFTRQSAETTTPMPTPSTSTSSPSTTTASSTTVESSEPPILGEDFSREGPAPVNQTAILEEERELMSSGQRFDIDPLVASNKSLLEANTRRVDQADPLLALNETAQANITQQQPNVTSNRSSVVLLSNNHSPDRKRVRLPPATVGKTAQKTARRMSTFGESLTPLEEVKADQRWQASGQKAMTSWSMRHLPGLVQRTLGSVFRRLAGVQHQQQPQPPVQVPNLGVQQPYHQVSPNSLGFGSNSAGINFLASALSAATAAASSSSLNRPMKASSLGEQMEGSAGGKLVAALQETREPLRQHANKKIIDSFIDLPVSERRLANSQQAAERRDDLASLEESSASNTTTARPQTSTMTGAGAGKRQGKNGSEWRRDEQAEDVGEVEPRLLNFRQDDDTEAAEEEEEEETNEPVARSSDSQQDEDSYETLASSELEFRTTTDANALDYVSDDEQLEAADSQDQPSYANAASQQEDMQPQFYLYSPHSSMLRPLKRLTNERGAVGEEQQAEERRLPSLRRRRPHNPLPSLSLSDPLATGKKRKPLGHLQRPLLIVPPISLQSVGRHRLSSTTSSTTTTTTTTTTSAPTTVAGHHLAAPATQVQMGQTGSAMMSPMSSSINVMDLDPSMTQLAHNKLIVAKYKPKKLKRPTVPTQIRHKRPQVGSSGDTPKGGSRQEVASLGPTPSESPTRAIASTILGNQVMSNNHINDIINRWTKLSSSSARPKLKQEDNPSSLGSRSSVNVSSLSIDSEDHPTSEGLDGRIGLHSGASSRTTTTPSPSEPPRAHEQWNTTGSARSNYSLLSMNNRERINPLLLPLELSKFIAPSNVSSTVNKRQQQQQPNRYSTAKQTTRRPSSTSASFKPESSSPWPQRQTTSTSRRPSLAGVNLHSLSSGNSTTTTTTNDDDEQILIRSQHHTKPVSGRRPQVPTVNRVKLTEAERLRNQYHGITGVSSALDGRQAGVGGVGEDEEGKAIEGISGHVTLVTSSSALLTSAATESADLSLLQEATNEANRYQLTGSEELQGSSPPSEHSIIIMSDNHHQTSKLKRPPSAAAATTTTSSAAVTTTMAPSSLAAQLARKYLEEFVNGSRLRPSSVANAKLGTANLDAPVDSSKLWTRSSHQPPFFTVSINNHSPQLQNHSFSQSGIRRWGSPNTSMSNMRPPQSEAARLDMRAQALLQDVLDREPSYSESFYAASKQKHQYYKSQPNIDLSRRINEENSGGNITNGFNIKSSTTPAYEITHYAMTGGFSAGDLTLDSTSPQEQSAESEQRHLLPTDATLSASTSSSALSTTTTTASVASFSTLDDSNIVDKPSSDSNTVAALSREDTTNRDTNNRASMRKNQAMIQSILMSMAKKNASRIHLVPQQPPQDDSGNISNQIDMGSESSISLDDYSTSSSQLDDRAEASTQALDDGPTPSSLATSGDLQPYNQSLYEPLKASASSNQTPSPRFPALKVETVGGTSRQKINKPLTPPTNDYSAGTTVAAASGLSLVSGPTPPTTKLTESPTSDSLRQAIKNRIHTANGGQILYEATSTMAPTASALQQQQLAASDEALPSDLAGDSIVVDTMEPVLELGDSQNPIATTTDESTEQQHHHNYPVPQLDDYHITTKRPPRPVIIRRRPRPQLVRRPQSNPQYLVVSSGQQQPQKRKRKPIRRPELNLDLIQDSLVAQQRPYAPLPNVTVSVLNEHETSGETAMDNLDLNLDLGQHQDHHQHHHQHQHRRRRPMRPILVHPRPELASAIIRKRPSYVRLPPGGTPPGSLRLPASSPSSYPKRRTRPPLQPAVNILLPMESIIKRPGQDIRTRPLTIIDPATEQPDINESGMTRLPETTVVHSNMVVPYKPGRPLPPGGVDSAAYLRPNQTTPMPDLSSPFNGNHSRPLVGDTHLVVIDGGGGDQQPALSGDLMKSTTSTTTTSTSTTTSTTPYPHRPLIVITGLPFDHPQHHQHQYQNATGRPHQPHSRPGGSTMVESGSMSVLANAVGNSSRPWYPTVTQVQSNQRHNATSNSTSGGVSPISDLDTSGSIQMESNSSSNSNQDSYNQFQASGNYQNHINHHQSQHIGMPYFPSGSGQGSQRPGQQRPYKWRVKKRPNGSSAGGGDLQTAATSNSHQYRPIAPGSSGSLSQLLNANGLTNLVDNVKILIARIRTFLISLMVMFLPPLSLAAAVASVMSSSS